MTFFLETVTSGLLAGVMYSLVALGFVLIFKASGMFNFAQGVLALFAGLTLHGLMSGTVPFIHGRDSAHAVHIWALIFTFIAAVLLAVVVLQWLISRTGPGFEMRVALLTTAGLALMLYLIDQAQGHVAFLTIKDTGQGLPAFLAIPLTIIVMIVLAYLWERFVMRYMINQADIVLFMSTLGLAYILEGFGDMFWGSDVKVLKLGLPSGASDFMLDNFNFYVDKLEIVAGVVAILLVTTLALFFSKTRIGRALRAVADDHQAALSVGISLRTIWVIVWSVAGIVALVAGVMWGAKSGIQSSLSLIALKALPVLILGGFTSIPGAIVGGLIIGVGEKLAEIYTGDLMHAAFGFDAGIFKAMENWFAFMLALIFLLFRPQGLFGDKIIERI